MGKFIDLTGQRFGNLTVIKRHIAKNSKRTFWECVCDCGNMYITRSDALLSNATKSCGCLQKQIAKNIIRKAHILNIKHGDSNSKYRIYKIWVGMRYRCYNKNHEAFSSYGGRGIKICEQWDEYLNFKEWALANGYSENLTLDRVDVNGNYEPDNCRWATQKAQSNNKRNNFNITYDGQTMTLSQWSDKVNINSETLYSRIVTWKWSIERALTEPIHNNHGRG